MGIFRPLFRIIDEIFLSIIWLRRVKIVDSDLNKISDLLNQHFITGASAEDIDLLKRIAKCSFSTRITTGAKIRTKDKNYTFRIIKYRVFLFFTFYRAAVYDDTVKGRRLMYYTYKRFNGYELIYYIDSYLHKKDSLPSIAQSGQYENINNSKAICDKCGAELNAESKFCSECGSPVEKHCPGCGAVVSETQNFCFECGTKIEQVENTVVNNTAAENTSGTSIYDMSIYSRRKAVFIGIAAVFILLLIRSIFFSSRNDNSYEDFVYDTDGMDYDFDDINVDDNAESSADSSLDSETNITEDVNSEDIINSVKYAVNTNYPNTTYGEAFDNFFGSPNWEYFVGSLDGSSELYDVVEFTGTCTADGVEGEALIQFTLYEDDTFKATYFSFDGVTQDTEELNGLLQAVFDSTLPEESTDSNSTASADVEYYGTGYTITVSEDWVQPEVYAINNRDLFLVNSVDPANITVSIETNDYFSGDELLGMYLNHIGDSGHYTFYDPNRYEEIDNRYYSEFYGTADNGYDTDYCLDCAVSANNIFYMFSFTTNDEDTFYKLKNSVKESFASVSFY